MKILVTGCTGTLGSELIPLLLNDGHDVVGVSRSELNQSVVPKHDRLILYLCDVRDRDRLLEASRGVDLVFHLAAMKRIECCEQQPDEAIGINVLGTQNVLFAQRMNRIPRVVLVSTDKACLPVTHYGTTKKAAERLVLNNPNNICVRYGNVIGSNGSVLQSFVRGIREKGTIEITHPTCTRFWWTIEAAAQYVYAASKRPSGGLIIPELKAYPVVSFGRAVAAVLGAPPPNVVEIGLRGVEKIHEDMRITGEGAALNSGDQSLWFSQSEIEQTLRKVLQV